MQSNAAPSAKSALLEALPEAYRASLTARMEPVTLPVQQMLYRPRETPRFAHFLTSGVASVHTLLGDGNGIAIGLIGSEGLIEALHLLGPVTIGMVAVMRVEGTAFRIPFADLRREFLTSELLRSVILQQIQQQGQLLNQLATCNHFHDVVARLARSLLMLQDRVGEPDFQLTQEFLAEMVGVHRPTLTLAAGRLQRQGLIRYSRGRIEICNRPGLQRVACECYQAVRDIGLKTTS